jgi:sortase (surface protein transpeptidase)
MDSERRNTIFMIVTIVAVCIVGLVGTFSLMWRLSGGAITRAIESLGRFNKLQNLNYNFEVPKTPDLDSVEAISNKTETPPPEVDIEEPTEEPVPEFNYNFIVPGFKANISEFRKVDSILDDAKILGLGRNPNEQTSIVFQIQIPKIRVGSLASIGQGEIDLLSKGFWVHPNSYIEQKGGIILLCYREFFSPNDIRSCYFLNKLSDGDSIYLKNQSGKVEEYIVTSIQELESTPNNLDKIYRVESFEDNLKIVTASIVSKENRLVINAKLK